MKNEMLEKLTALPLECGAFKANVIKTEKIETDRRFRDMCEANSCGIYGKCWMCPPNVGDIDLLMGEIAKYDYALVYQTVFELEDSFDFEGMVSAKKKSYKITQNIREKFDKLGTKKSLHLGSGGCGVCPTCAKRDEQPCRFPNLAIASLEAYGINVSQLAKAAEMKYINGADTVTYFGAVLFSLDGERYE